MKILICIPPNVVFIGCILKIDKYISTLFPTETVDDSES